MIILCVGIEYWFMISFCILLSIIIALPTIATAIEKSKGNRASTMTIVERAITKERAIKKRRKELLKNED